MRGELEFSSGVELGKTTDGEEETVRMKIIL